MTFGDRLAFYREKAGYSQKELADKLDIIPTRLNYYEKGKREPNLNMLDQICDALHTTSDALLGQPQRGLDIQQEEIAFITKRRFLDDHGRDTLNIILDRESERCKQIETLKTQLDNMDTAEIVYLPLQLSIQPVSAGKGTYLGPGDMDIIFVEENPTTKRASFAVRISGDSMEPEYSDGEIILVDSEKDIPIGSIGVFTLNNEGYVKKLGDGELISLNKNYDPIKMNESIICNGKVIGKLDPEWVRP